MLSPPAQLKMRCISRRKQKINIYELVLQVKLRILMFFLYFCGDIFFIMLFNIEKNLYLIKKNSKISCSLSEK